MTIEHIINGVGVYCYTTTQNKLKYDFLWNLGNLSYRLTEDNPNVYEFVIKNDKGKTIRVISHEDVLFYDKKYTNLMCSRYTITRANKEFKWKDKF